MVPFISKLRALGSNSQRIGTKIIISYTARRIVIFDLEKDGRSLWGKLLVRVCFLKTQYLILGTVF